MYKLKPLNKKIKGYIICLIIVNSFCGYNAFAVFFDPGPGGGGGGDTTPPNPISNLECKPFNGTVMMLRWDASTSRDVMYYKICRNGVQIDTVNRIFANYTDCNVQPYNFYTYSVTPVDYSANQGITVYIYTNTALQWWVYLDDDGETTLFPDYMSDWSQPYIAWMDQWKIIVEADGYFEGNKVFVTFQPRSYVPGSEEVSLIFDLAVHIETNAGGPNDFPQPTLDDNLGVYDFFKPMVIKESKIIFTLLQESGGFSDQHINNILTLREQVQNSLLGRYSCPDSLYLLNKILNGKFEGGLNNWHPYNTENGGIGTTADSPVSLRDDVLQVYSECGGELGVIQEIDFPSGGYTPDLFVNYYGKKNTVGVGNDQGIKITVQYIDNSFETFTPDQLKISADNHYWHPYQHSFSFNKLVKWVQVKAYNSEGWGSAYFDNIHVTPNEWHNELKGNVQYNSQQNIYENWYSEMSTALSYNEKLDNFGQAISVIDNINPNPYIGGLLSIGNFFLNAMKLDIDPLEYQAIGSTQDQASVSQIFNHMNGHIGSNGEFGFALACDDLINVKYELYTSDPLWQGQYIRDQAIKLQIEVEVSWGYIGDIGTYEDLDCDTLADTTTLTFEVPISLWKWNDTVIWAP